MKTISSKVNEKEFRAFSQYAKETNLTISKLIRKLLREKIDVEKYSCLFRHTDTTCSFVHHSCIRHSHVPHLDLDL